MAYITFKNISESIIEAILIEPSKNNKIEDLATSNNKSNSLIGRINSTNKKY
jgi:hypothetical protein